MAGQLSAVLIERQPEKYQIADKSVLTIFRKRPGNPQPPP